MYRPNVPAMDEIESVLRDIRDMEKAIRELKERLCAAPIEIICLLPTFNITFKSN